MLDRSVHRVFILPEDWIPYFVRLCIYIYTHPFTPYTTMKVILSSRCDRSWSPCGRRWLEPQWYFTWKVVKVTGAWNNSKSSRCHTSKNFKKPWMTLLSFLHKSANWWTAKTKHSPPDQGVPNGLYRGSFAISRTWCSGARESAKPSGWLCCRAFVFLQAWSFDK